MNTIKKNKKILVAGASSDLAVSLVEMLYNSEAIIGLHYNSNEKPLLKYTESARVKKIKKNLDSDLSCKELVDDFADWAGGIDCLVQLTGNIKNTVHWEDLTDDEWSHDLYSNLTVPFMLAKRAVYYMKERGGQIVLTSTASAIHGGGSTSLAYGAAKSGVECVVRGLARDCAKYNILVNAIAPGFIPTKFHTEKMKRSEKELEERIKLIPLKRAGTTQEIAGTILFLLSEYSTYITGQVIAISGGDWL